MTGKIVARIVSGLVFIIIVAGIAFMAYQAGVASGPPVTIEAPSGESVPAPYPHFGYGYGKLYHHPFMWGFECLVPIFGVFLLVLALKSFRMMMWGPRWGWGNRHGHWGERSVPPMFDEWHKRSHGEGSEEKKES
ncbi:MAG TPA: hypothetical protein VIS72_06780 [Anaerolineales bacterium]